MMHLADLSTSQRRALRTLARLGEGQTLVPLLDVDAQACDALQKKGLAAQPDDDVDDGGYRLTTQGHALAEGL